MTTFLTVAQYVGLSGSYPLTGDTFILKDDSTNLQALTTVDIAALDNNGISGLDATDDALSFTVAQFQALDNSVALDASDIVILADTGANMAAAPASFFQHLDAIGVAVIAPTDDVLSLSVLQYQAIGSMHIATGATVTLLDSGATIAGLSAAQLGALAGAGIDIIDANDDVLNLTAAQAINIAGTVALTAGDTVTIKDTGANIANITAAQFALLVGLDKIKATDSVLSLTVSQYLAIPATALTAGDTVTLADSKLNLANLTALQISALTTNGIDKIDSSNNAIEFTVAQYEALIGTSVTIAGNDTLSIKDTGANIAGMLLAEFTALASHGVAFLDASDDTLTLTAAKFNALGTVTLRTLSDFITIADTGTNLAALNMAALAGKGVDAIDATDNVLTLTLQNITDLGTVQLTAGDTVTVADLKVNIEGLDASAIAALGTKGVDVLDSTNNALNLSEAQAAALLTAGIHLTAGDTVTIVDTGSNIALLTADQIGNLASFNFDAIDASNDLLSLTVAQFNALGTVTLASGDTVTIADTGANIATLDFSTLAGKNVDILDASDNVLAITVAQFQAIVLAAGALQLTAGDTVTLLDTAANIQALTDVDIGKLDDNGIDVIDSTDDTLALSLAQISALGTVQLTQSDVVTLTDSQANLEALNGTNLGDLATLGVDILDSTNNALNLGVAQIVAILNAGLSLTAADTVVIVDTGANIQGLTAAQIDDLAGINVDRIDANDGAFSLTTAKYLALGSVALTAGDTVTLSDTGAAIAGLSANQFAALAGKGIDVIDASNDLLSLSVAQYQGLGAVTLTPTDVVTLADLGATIATLTAVEIGQLAGNGIDVINATDNTLSLNVAKYFALGAVNLTAGDTVTLRDTGANLAALTPLQLAALPAKGVDTLDATNDVIVFTLAQAVNLNSSQLAANDTIVINGTNASETINAFAFNDVIRGAGGNDRLNGRSGDDLLSGGTGHDVMTGSAGADRFLFNTAASLANVDRITDFTVGLDHVLLENAVFKAAGKAGVLTADRFFVGSAAHDLSDRIIYDANNGNLWYDSDGTGAAAKKLIAHMSAHLALFHGDFFVV